MRIWTSLLILVGFAAPLPAAAHARWFAPGGEFSPHWDRLFSVQVLLALLVGVGAVLVLAGLQRVVGDPLWPRPAWSQKLEPSAPAILGVQTAITMIFLATRLSLFAPTIVLPRSLLGGLVAAVAIAAAFTFITGLFTRAGALVTLALLAGTLVLVPWYQTLEQAIYAGIALYLFAVGRGVVRADDRRDDERSPWSDRLLPHALTILRVSAGVSVLVLAFTEKLLNVELGLAFLGAYPHFNVLAPIGVSDAWFVYLAGIVEATAGIALLAGFLPRVVILGLWIPFNLGIPFLPAEELIGHLPILSSMYVLLVRGTEGIPAPAAAQDADPYPAQQAGAVVPEPARN
jgi:uncharacterized membrane protein YphA (DoxX/SURF4 family)